MKQIILLDRIKEKQAAFDLLSAVCDEGDTVTVNGYKVHYIKDGYTFSTNDEDGTFRDGCWDICDEHIGAFHISYQDAEFVYILSDGSVKVGEYIFKSYLTLDEIVEGIEEKCSQN